MALKDLLNMTKTDRYTADGRDKINELQAKVTEDVTYKTGDISQKTGLQKQPDGSWAPPKGGAAGRKMSKEEIEERKSKGITPADINKGKSYTNENGAKIEITGFGGDGSVQFLVTAPDGTKQAHQTSSKEQMERILSVNGYTGQTAAESKPDALNPTKKKEERIGQMQKETGKEAPYGRTLKGTPKTPDDNPLTERTQKRSESKLESDFDDEGGSTETKPVATPQQKAWADNMLRSMSNPNIEDYIKTLRENNSAESNKYPDPEQYADILEEAYKQKKEKNAGWMKELYSKYGDVIEKNPKLKKWFEIGRAPRLRVKNEGTYLGEEALGRVKEIQQENRRRTNPISFTMESMELDETNAKNLLDNYTDDSAPRILTGDTKIRVRK